MFTEDDRKNIAVFKDLLHKNIEQWFEDLKLKYDDWSAVEALKKWITDNCVVSGGVSASVWHGDKIKDIDWFYNGDDHALFAVAVEKLLIAPSGKFHDFVKEIDPKYMAGVGGGSGRVITANAVTLVNNMQIIRLDTASNMRRSFDFLHCLPVYNYNQQIYHISYAQYDSIKRRRLVANPTGRLVGHRVEKFRERGWDTSGVAPEKIL